MSKILQDDEGVGEIIAQHFRSAGLSPPSSEDVALQDSGLTSLQVVDIILLLEDWLGREIPEADLTPENFHCVRSIAEMIGRLRAGEEL